MVKLLMCLGQCIISRTFCVPSWTSVRLDFGQSDMRGGREGGEGNEGEGKEREGSN